MAAPIGKGLFLRTTDDLERFGRWLRYAGFTWVAAFGDARGGEAAFRITPEQIKTLRLAGIDVHVCVYNTHGNLDIAKRAYERVMGHGGAGIVIDAEGDYYDERAARLLVRAARSFGGSLGFLGLRAMPDRGSWRHFVEATDWSGPQTYDRDGNWGPETIPRLLEGYRKGGARTIIAGFGAYQCHIEDGERRCRYTKTPEELHQHLSHFPAIRAVAGWTLPSFQARPEDYLAQWEVLAGWDPLKAPWIADVVPGGRWALAQLVS